MSAQFLKSAAPVLVAAQVIKLEFALNDAMVRLRDASKPSDIDAAARQLADIFGMASVTVGVAGTASAVGGALPKVAGLVDDVAAGAKALGDTPSGLAPVTTGGTLAHRLPPAQSRTPPTFNNPVPPEALVPLAIKDGIYRVPLNRQMEWGGQREIGTQTKIVSVDSNGAASGLRFRDDYESHVAKRDMSVPRKRGIGGAHNLDEFNKVINELNVLSRTPHPTVKGVERIEYQIPALDRANKPTGGWMSEKFKKTVYDPRVISDKQMMEWSRQAYAEAQASGRINLSKRSWEGYAPNGIKFFGYGDASGAVKTSFPDF